MKCAALIIFAFLQTLTNDALACMCDKQSVEAGLNTARYVFFARVTSARLELKGDDRWLVLGLSEVIPNRGGKPPGKVKTPGDSAMCGQQILIPEYYWFFVDSDGTFTSCSATQPSIGPETIPLNMEIHDQLIEVKRATSD